MALYSIRNKETGAIRLVDAQQNAQALRHVAEDVFEVLVAKPRQIAELVSKGVVLETYGETSQTELQEGQVNGEAG
jgi:hypothetical protein